MDTIRVRVENGKVVGDAPPGIPDGTELLLKMAEPEDALTPEELADLHAALDRGWACLESGQVRSTDDVLGELRSRR